MRILIVSDTHGKNKNLKRVLDMEAPVDLLIHLGDACCLESEIADMVGCPLEIIAGNCDFFSQLEREKNIKLENLKVFITHGNYYDVESGIDDIEKVAIGNGADIVMFGHTHRPVIDYGDGIIALNPGSLCMPRQEGRRCSYAMMEFDRKGNPHIEIKYLVEK